MEKSKNIIRINELKTENIFGQYAYSLKGEYPDQCEIALHLLNLNNDSTFTLRLYCRGDTSSLLKSTIKKGTWNKLNDSVLNFIDKDIITFQAKILSDRSIQIFARKKELFTPSFAKDTTNYVQY